MDYALRWYFAEVYWLNEQEKNELSIDDVYTISIFWFSKKSWQSYKDKPDDIKLNLCHRCQANYKYLKETEKVKELKEYAELFRDNYLEVYRLFLKDFDYNGDVVGDTMEYYLPWPLEFNDCFINLDKLKDFSKIKEQNPDILEKHFRFCYENEKDIRLKDYYKNIYKK